MNFGEHKQSVLSRDYLSHFLHLTDENLRSEEVKSLFPVTQLLEAGPG